MRKTLLAMTTVVTLAFGAASARAAINLVQNGDFSANTLPALGIEARTGLAYTGAEIDSHYLYNGAVTGWTTPNAANGQDYNLYFLDGATAKNGNAASRYGSEDQRPNVNFSGPSPDGGAFMALDADPGFSGRFEQSVGGLVVGQNYILSFYWAAGELSNRKGYETSQMTGTFGGDAFATSVFTNSKPYYNNPTSADGDFSGWRLVSYGFTAHTTTQLLSFLAVGTPSMNLPPVAFLDGVSLTAAPEPATWALMLIGFAGLGVAVRRRRSKLAGA